MQKSKIIYTTLGRIVANQEKKQLDEICKNIKKSF